MKRLSNLSTAGLLSRIACLNGDRPFCVYGVDVGARVDQHQRAGFTVGVVERGAQSIVLDLHVCARLDQCSHQEWVVTVSTLRCLRSAVSPTSPSSSRMFGSAPASSSNLTASTWSCSEAKCKPVQFIVPYVMFTSTPDCRMALIAGRLPCFAAQIIGFDATIIYSAARCNCASIFASNERTPATFHTDVVVSLAHLCQAEGVSMSSLALSRRRTRPEAARR